MADKVKELMGLADKWAEAAHQRGVGSAKEQAARDTFELALRRALDGVASSSMRWRRVMDNNVNAAARHFDQQEAAAESACARAATAHGLTADQAESCDDGNQGCPTCPWRKPAPGVAAGGKTVDETRNEGQG